MNNIFLGFLISLITACSMPQAYSTSLANCGLYEYRANITSVYDGDTVRADIDLGFNTWRMNEPLRLLGIDTPEMRGSDKPQGIIARDALRAFIEGKTITVCTQKDEQGKYGRYLATIYADGVNVNQWLLDNGYAVPYE